MLFVIKSPNLLIAYLLTIIRIVTRKVRLTDKITVIYNSNRFTAVTEEDVAVFYNFETKKIQKKSSNLLFKSTILRLPPPYSFNMCFKTMTLVMDVSVFATKRMKGKSMGSILYFLCLLSVTGTQGHKAQGQHLLNIKRSHLVSEA